MALDNGYNVNKQLPQYPDVTVAEPESMYTNNWPMEKVTQWLEANGWGSVAPLFELNHIEGEAFLSLTMAQLAKVLFRAGLAYSDKKRLLNGIHSIQAEKHQEQQQQEASPPLQQQQYQQQQWQQSQGSTTDTQDGKVEIRPSHYLDTSSQDHGDMTRYMSPVSTVPSPQVPPLSYSNTSSTSSATVSPSSASSMESEYAKIRPYIPERKSSNPVQISKIMKQFNVPPTLSIGRTRPNPIIARRSNNVNGNHSLFQNSVHPPPQHHPAPPISPRQVGDMDGGWKISRRPGMKSKQGSMTATGQQQQQHQQQAPTREQRIQVTLDSDTFFSLTVTNIQDPTALKTSIVKKLGMSATYLDHYQFYHENGDNSDIPLEDDELVYICGHSDNSKHRILLKSNYPHLHVELTSPSSAVQPQRSPTSMHQPPQAASLWAVPPRSLTNTSPSSPRDEPPSDIPSVALWAVPPKPIQQQQQQQLPSPVSASLWAVPPRPLPQQQNDQPKSASLWAVPPRSSQDPISSNTTTLPSTTNANATSPSASLWAIPPSPMSMQSNNNSATPTPSPSASLWAVPPKQYQQQQPSPVPSPTSSATKTSPPSASLWAVPPKANPEQLSTEETTVSSGLWAVPPRVSPSNSSTTSSSLSNTSANSYHQNQHYQQQQQQQHTSIPSSTPASVSSSLWAVPPQSLTYPEHTHSPTAETAGEESTVSDSLEGMTLTDAPYTHTSSASTPASIKSSPLLRPALVQPRGPSSSTSTPRSQRRLQIQIPSSQQHQQSQSSPRASPHQLPSSTSSSPATATATTGAPMSSSLHTSSPTSSSSARQGSSPSMTTSFRTPSETGSPVSSSQDLTDTEEDNWAERPSIEKLYRDIDKYLPGHDLDKEILLDGDQPPPAPSTSSSSSTVHSISDLVAPLQQQQQQPASLQQQGQLPLTRRLQGHKKSIRVVAKEAHRNWRQAVNVIRVNNILRRRSTKLWGHKVQQVKPGMALDSEKDDTPTTLPDGKPAPTKFRWARGQLIGKGSYGRVYHAFSVAAGEWIAVKQVDIPTTSSDRHNKQLHETADALYREILLLKDLEHDNIVQYLGYDVDEEEGHINIFLEYVPGGSIASCLSKQGKFDECLVSYFTRQILLGLEYLHFRNILHRDIKAGNVLLTSTGCCKITDFGLSKLSGQDKAYDAHGNNSVMRGTVFWMAPEVVSGTNYNAKVDIWSLGCTVIEMLTGKHPWLDMNMLAALYSLGRFEAPPIPEDISENAKSFLNLCFKINPEERPTAADLLVHPFVGQNPSFKFKDYTKS